MSEKYTDTELIDKYLFENLSQEEQAMFDNRRGDPAFNKEIEMYEKMHQGIRESKDKELKARLEGYFQDYVNDGSKGKQINLNWIGGIAASLLILSLIGYYTYYTPTASKDDLLSEDPGEIKMDSLQIDSTQTPSPTPDQKNLAEDIDSGKKRKENSEILNRNAYALGGYVALESEQVRTLNYPQQLSYSFDGENLTITGDPLIPALRLDIYKEGNQFYLQYKDDFYSLAKTNSLTSLKKSGFAIDNYEATDEEIVISFKSLLPSSEEDSQLIVTAKKEAGNTYFFTKKDGKLTLNLAGLFKQEDIEVFSIKTKTDPKRYVLINDIIYQIGNESFEKQTLMPVSASTMDLPGLFKERDNLRKTVKVVE